MMKASGYRDTHRQTQVFINMREIYISHQFDTEIAYCVQVLLFIEI